MIKKSLSHNLVQHKILQSNNLQDTVLYSTNTRTSSHLHRSTHPLSLAFSPLFCSYHSKRIVGPVRDDQLGLTQHCAP